MASKEVFGTKEWAKVNANCCEGCSHNCRYCYAKAMASQYKRRRSSEWQIEKVDMLKIKSICDKRPTKVMFPTAHDITPNNLDACITSIEKLLKAGHELLIVSKPHVYCIAAIVDAFPLFCHKIVFRFSIGSAHDFILKLWEPGAPCFQERVLALQYARMKDFRTSVSCEPMLDTYVEDVVRAVSPYVTGDIWFGLPNMLMNRLSLNGESEGIKKKGRELLDRLNDDFIKHLYKQWKGEPRIRWKDSIKKIVGIERPTEVGLDI